MKITPEDITVLIIAIILISIYLNHWLKVSQRFYTDRSIIEEYEDIPITFLCPFKDEQDNILNLLKCIKSIPNNLQWKWILINDHSRDNTMEIIKQFQGNNPKINL